MAHALVRSAGSMHRLAQASVASSVLVSDWVQPVGITSLLAWHRQSTIDHRKLFSSEDKQSTPHATAQDQAEASKQSGPGKPQQAAAGATTGMPCHRPFAGRRSRFVATTVNTRQSLSRLG